MATAAKPRKQQVDLKANYLEKYGFSDLNEYLEKFPKGLSHELIALISKKKQEPKWMADIRHEALEVFWKKPMPKWGDQAILNSINFDDIHYYIRPSDKVEGDWENVPEKIKKTFDRLGIPEAERKFLAGVTAQYDSEAVYHSIKKELTEIGVVFTDMDTGLKEYPEKVREHFGKVIPTLDNKFAALNTAVWSGGSFVWVPEGIHVEIPLQAYFRINAENAGQFERTLIIAEPNSRVHYIEGCLPEGELVSRGDTMCPIEEVQVGETVMNSAGVEAPVEAIRRRQYSGDMLRIVPVSVGNSFELTPEHPVWAFRRENIAKPHGDRPIRNWDVAAERLFTSEPEWVPAGELKEGDILCFPVAVKERDQPQLSEDHLKFLGYYLAEGSAFRNGVSNAPTVTLSFNLRERHLVEDAIALMTRLAGKPAGEFQNPDKNESRVYIYDAPLMEFAQKFCGTGSATKRLHADLMALPPARQKVLVDAYLCGDGSRHERGNGATLVRATTVSRTLAYQLQEIFARLGIYAGIQIRKAFAETMKDGRRIQHKEAYSIHFEEGRRVRQTWHDEGRRCFWVPIRKIEKRAFSGWVHNLEMQSAPNAYLARGFAVHNCTAPVYSTNSLHSAVVELTAMEGAYIRYTTIQNWADNIYNLVTKRAVAEKNATVEWVDGNIGSKLTMKFPCVVLNGEGAKGEILSVAFAGDGQHQDAGAKVIHAAPNTTSRVISKSISKNGGRASYRGLVKVYPNAHNCKVSVECDALMLDDKSRSDTYPTMEIAADQVSVEHEARVSKISEEQTFYLMSRGLTEDEARLLIVNGFIEPFTKSLPMEYAVELNRLIEMEMEGSVG